ncbi:unnamed protein product [Parnassius mnemosyne]|uniref:Tyr recombinase domain-containing protein n=1 Tax=Parnassius mnemosyne TaxID=213953 RepID=A0AAV1KVY6_9NEOP
MGGTGSNRLYNENNFWSSYPFLKQTPSKLPISYYKKTIQDQRVTGNDKNNYRLKETTSVGETKVSKSKLPFEDVYNTKERWILPTSLRPARTQQVCPYQTFPTDIPCLNTRIPSKGGLDGENRHIQCLFPHTNCRIPSLLSPDDIQQRTITNEFASFWPGICSSHFCSGYKLDRGDPAKQGNSGSSLSRRFPIGSPGPSQAGLSDCGSRETLGVYGLANKLPKVCAEANATIRVFRNNLEHQDRHNVSLGEKNKKYKNSNYKIIKQKGMQSKTGAKNSRTTKLRQFCHKKGSPALPLHSNTAKTLQAKFEKQKSPATTSTTGPQVVESVISGQGSSTSATIYPLPHNRCGRYRLGGPVEREDDVRSLDKRSDEMALELERAVRSICVNPETITLPTECSHSSPVGQSNPCGVYSERRGDPLNEFTQSDVQVVEADRQEKHSPISTLPPGEVQLHSRSPLTGTATVRMASAARCNKPIVPSLGNPRCRSIRVCRNRRSQQIRLLRLERQFGNIPKCLQSGLEFSARVDISSSQLDPSSISSIEPCQGSLHINSSSMGKDLLASRFKKSGTGTTSDNRENFGEFDRHRNGSSSTTSRPTEPSGLVSWRWAKSISRWSESEKQLLNSSWRPSTLSTYYPAIKRWIKWCDLNNVSCNLPQPHQIARFLAHLHLEEKLAYSTILVHKSAIYSFCKIDQNQAQDNSLVHQILKAIAMAQPPKSKAPIWDVQIVFDWLATSSIKNTIFEVSRRTAAILLLASGRRVHDLTLLKISEANLRFIDNKVTLWPIFGSKTDSACHRQSGWSLLKHPNQKVCPVLWIRRLIDITQERRNEQEGLNHLFITIIGKPRPASRTVIGGWIKTVLKDAGITASPGSFRSAVASASWVEDHPVDEILARGNWKSENTFRKFYCKEVEKKCKRSELLFNNFQPE